MHIQVMCVNRLEKVQMDFLIHSGNKRKGKSVERKTKTHGWVSHTWMGVTHMDESDIDA